MQAFNTPILLITFNRPNHTRRVFEEIKKQKPRQLFVFQDGAREGNEADMEKCAAVRAIFAELLDWDCELKTYYSDKNLGCGLGPATGISWFFENVEQGIIIEDDCLPHTDFFLYCAYLLEKYKDNKEIMFVGATTYHDHYPCEESYCFSKYLIVGAWASWRRAWQGYDFDLKNLDLKDFRQKLKKQFYSSAETNWWIKKVKEIQADTSKKSYWDYQFQVHLLNNAGLAVMPHKNMISNIGFDAEGTHTTSNDGRGERLAFGCLPLQHPSAIANNKQYDYLYLAKARQLPVHKRIIQYVYDLMNENNGFLKKILLSYKQKKSLWKTR
jgi:hypothetical protein